MRNDDSRPPAPGTFQTSHDQLEEQQRGFRRAPVLGEVVEDACLFLAAKGRVCQDDVDALILADFRQTKPQRVAGIDARGVKAVQQQVELGQQERQRFGFATEEAVFLQGAALFDRVGLPFEVLVGLGQKAPVPQAGSRMVSPSFGSVTSTMKRTTGRGV